MAGIRTRDPLARGPKISPKNPKTGGGSAGLEPGAGFCGPHQRNTKYVRGSETPPSEKESPFWRSLVTTT